MKKHALTFATLMLCATNTFAKTSPGLSTDVKHQQNAGLSFTENKGQVHDQNYKPRPDVLYGAMTGNMAVHIKNNGVSYQLYRVDKSPSPTLPKGERASLAAFSFGERLRDDATRLTVYRIDLTWLNTNTNFTRSEDEALPGYDNYYLESCPGGALNVKSYTGITLKNLYNGINLHYYQKNGELKHDYIVAPHSDYRQIQLKIDGAEISVNADGSLILSTPLGKIQEGAPVVYQNGKQLNARWIITDTERSRSVRSRSVNFEIENYNPNFELLIDPVTRLWGTYYGGTGTLTSSGYPGDYGSSCVTDGSGNVYLVGQTRSSTSMGTVIATTGSHQSVFGGNDDAFLVKFNPNGVRQWATYYGGAGTDGGAGSAIDAFGNIYMSGGSTTNTNAASVIATIGSHQPTGGGGIDAFLVKFNSNGVRLWGTYYGGTGSDGGGMCTIDVSGNVYLPGRTDSPTSTVIATIGSHQPVKGTGSDAFLVKFDANGVRQWGTYYGGIGSDDAGGSCATDATGNVYMSGDTNSPSGTVIATPGSHQPAIGGNVLDRDAFLVKFNANGTRLWGTYYGGTQFDPGGSCATDAVGNVYLSGSAGSGTGTVIATPGSHQPSFGNINPAVLYDAFLVKFNSNGVRQWGTYYGGTGKDCGFSCAIDGSGNVYLAGYTESNVGTVIATAGSHQSTNGGGFDAFLVKFNSNGVRQSATYYGGTGDDWAHFCTVDASDNAFMTGYTDSPTSTAIATTVSHQPSLGGDEDAFLVKFACALPPQPSAINGNTIICSDWGVNTYSTAIVMGATSYTWSLPAGWSGSGNTNTISATPGSSGVFTVTANNACGASQPQTLNITVSACTGLKENNNAKPGMKIYPNPTSGIINLELDSDNEVIVMNPIGQIVYTSKLSSGHHQINLENLAKGMYVVKIGGGSNSKNIKLIKE